MRIVDHPVTQAIIITLILVLIAIAINTIQN